MKLKPDPSPGRQHSLADIPKLPAASVAALRRHWIETAEQSLATSATPEGRAGLKALLACDEAVLDSLLAALQSVVGPAEARRLTQPTPGGACGLVLTDEQKRRHGAQ